MDKKLRGIYVAEDLVAHKAYIGSTEDQKHRFKKHNVDLKRNQHHNKHLQAAYNNGNQFRVLFIPVQDDVAVKDVEQVLISEFIDTGVLYNIARDVNSGGGMLGMKHSSKTLARLSEIAKERGMPRAIIEAGAAARVGKKLSPDRVEKLRQDGIERMESPEARFLSGSAMRGKSHSPESIALMKEVCAGRTFSPQAIEARQLAMVGRVQTPEEIEKRTTANTGKVRTGEALRNIQASAQKRAKPVIADGILYENTKALAEAFNITPSAAKRRIIRSTGNYENWNYVE